MVVQFSSLVSNLICVLSAIINLVGTSYAYCCEGSCTFDLIPHAYSFQI